MNDTRLEETMRKIQAEAGAFLVGQALHSSQAQDQFLHSRMETLRQMGELVKLQAELAGAQIPGEVSRPVLIERTLLEEFAAGSIERGLGPEYAVFQGRRVPRIPNGALLLMDRVLEIRGERGHLNQPSEIQTEFDVPGDAWFFTDSGSAVTPYSILMELALQPCGFLSAYLGTMLIHPNSSLFFRNLDGEARILRKVDLRGQTVRGWARMVSHTVNEETVIQKFEFHLETGGQIFFAGQSVFGFFPEDTMLRQVGLDGGKESLPIYLQPEAVGLAGRLFEPAAVASPAGLRLATGRLSLLDEVYIQPTGGSYGKGYIYAVRSINPRDWYFTNHFFQDPVMPGSLGIEAILEALRAYAITQGLDAGMPHPKFELVEDLPFTWKYRGQILPATGEMQLEIQVRQVEDTQTGKILVGDASLWAGNTRIYLVKNAAIRIAKG